MNKRFSTLLAAALVAGGVSASAQTKAIGSADDILANAKSGDYVTLADADDNFLNVVLDKDGKATNALTTAGTPKNFTGITMQNAFNSMWKIEIIAPTSAAGIPTYKFVNKLTQQSLAVDLVTNGKDGVSTTEVELSEYGNDEWAFNSTLGLYAVSGDSTFFIKEAGNIAVLAAVEGGVREAITAAAGDAFVITPGAIAADASIDLTPAGFNLLNGGNKLTFANNKDVKNPTVTPGNILTANNWVARSASNTADSLTSKDLFLTNTKVTASGNPYMLMSDTLFYTMTSTVADQLNQLICDTITVSGTALPKWEANGRYTYGIEENGQAVTRGTGDDAKTVATRPSASAVFTGKYFVSKDSLVLIAKNKTVKPTTDKVITTIVNGANIGQIALKSLDGNKIVLLRQL